MVQTAYESLSFHIEKNKANIYVDFYLDFFFSTCLVPVGKQHRLVNAIERISFTTVWHNSG